MIKLIIGKKGSGKTKRLVDSVNTATKESLGNVVCIEKGDALTHSVNNKARLIDTEDFGISGYSEYYGLIAGVRASNYDVTHIFGDATLRIGGGDFEELAAFFKRISKIEDVQFVFTISADESEIPASVFELAEKM